MSSPLSGDNPDFWPCLYKLVLKGQLLEGRKLLAHHPLIHIMPQVWRSLKLSFYSIIKVSAMCVLMFHWSLLMHLSTNHSLTHSQAHASMDELLRKAPMILSTASHSRAELQRRWSEWRSECVRRRVGGEFAAEPKLDFLAAVSADWLENFPSHTHSSLCRYWVEKRKYSVVQSKWLLVTNLCKLHISLLSNSLYGI